MSNIESIVRMELYNNNSTLAMIADQKLLVDEYLQKKDLTPEDREFFKKVKLLFEEHESLIRADLLKKFNEASKKQ